MVSLIPDGPIDLSLLLCTSLSSAISQNLDAPHRDLEKHNRSKKVILLSQLRKLKRKWFCSMAFGICHYWLYYNNSRRILKNRVKPWSLYIEN
jgi:hypothetical protein